MRPKPAAEGARPWPWAFFHTLLGSANVFVTNIGPHDPEGAAGGVEFYLHVEWDSPLDVMVTITVLEDVETTWVA
jgi:hypothetical protein